MKYIKQFLLVGCTAAVLSCTPEDETGLGAPISADKIRFSVTQESTYDNKIYLENQTEGVIPYWDYEVGTSTRPIDTVIIPFAGEFWIKCRAFDRAGSATDSAKVKVSEIDMKYFSHPYWNALTKIEEGKKWKLTKVYIGPESDYHTNWWQPDISTAEFYNDTAYFDLRGGYHYKRTHNGTVQATKFTLDIEKKVLELKGKVTMPVYNYSNEKMTVNKYRIFELTDERMILGQGASYTEDKKKEDWAWFSVYEPL